MNDLAIQTAGGLAIVAAVIHGVLGETRVFARTHIESASTRRLLRLVWQCSTTGWIGLAVLLCAAPYMDSPTARLWIVAAAVGVYGSAACANAWATSGRHFGWMVLAGVVLLALIGL